VNVRLEQRILHVDVPNAGNPALVEQEGLDRPAPPAQKRPELFQSQVSALGPSRAVIACSARSRT
jgi:hypothetical protein